MNIFCCAHRRRYLIVAFSGALLILGSPARADTSTESSSWWRITIMEENDKISSKDDRHYTQGMRISLLSEAVTPDGWWDQPYGWLNDNLPIFGGSDRKRKYEATIIGQSLFTPSDTSRLNSSLKDRPYAAWLYTGASLLQETNHENYQTFENAELLMRVVGAAALGDVTQNDFHQFIDVSPAIGWHNQLKNEPGFTASYERKWRFQMPLIGNFGIDAIPELGVSGGNILTYGEAGGVVRFGQNLAADYGPERIRPGLSGTAWFDRDKLDGNIGWSVYLGAQSRLVGRNIFLDGNSFVKSPSVEKKLFVTDFMGGASIFWSSSARVDFSVIERTKEFYGQKGHPDRFGGINFAFQF